jgi:UDP-N-acetylmuramate dehydrogenase
MGETVHLGRLTTFRIGGTPVRYFHPHTEADLLAALTECRRTSLPWRVLGGGSNLLVDEGQLPYAVIHVHTPGFDVVERTDVASVRVGAGVPTGRLLAYCRGGGLGGLEFMAALPGTIGGAIAGNAGAWGKEICATVTRLRLITPAGEVAVIPHAELQYSYRQTELRGAVITEAELDLDPRDPKLIAMQMTEYARARCERHPMSERSAGCVFKNPPGVSAGKLLDECGLRGRKIGDAEVSVRHANFIVNRGGAAAGDVLRLIEVMRSAVRREFGIELELEVRHWPARAKVA